MRSAWAHDTYGRRLPVVKRLLVALAALAVAFSVATCVARAGRGTFRSNRPGVAALTRKFTPRRPGTAGSGWKLTLDAGFPGARLDTSMWATCYPRTNPAAGCTNFGNSDEMEWYLRSQVHVSAGTLHLVARRVPTLGRNREGGAKEYFCRSGMVTSYPGFHFRYGYLQIVARVPRGAGLWPALWLVPVRDQWPPEIDILEEYGDGDAAVYYHPAVGPRIGGQTATANLSVGWHTFGLYWTRSSLTWFIDGREVMSISQHIPHLAMYLIADLADYVRPASGGCTGAMLVKSVKLWQR